MANYDINEELDSIKNDVSKCIRNFGDCSASDSSNNNATDGDPLKDATYNSTTKELELTLDSGKKVKADLSDLNKDIKLNSGTYNKSTNKLNLKLSDNSTIEIDLSELAKDIKLSSGSYDKSTKKLNLKLSDNNTVGVDLSELAKDVKLSSGAYDSATKKLNLKLSDNNTIGVDLSDLAKDTSLTYKKIDSTTDGCNPNSFVILSAMTDNVKLYLPTSPKDGDRVIAKVEGNIYNIEIDGNSHAIDNGSSTSSKIEMFTNSSALEFTFIGAKDAWSITGSYLYEKVRKLHRVVDPFGIIQNGGRANLFSTNYARRKGSGSTSFRQRFMPENNIYDIIRGGCGIDGNSYGCGTYFNVSHNGIDLAFKSFAFSFWINASEDIGYFIGNSIANSNNVTLKIGFKNANTFHVGFQGNDVDFTLPTGVIRDDIKHKWTHFVVSYDNNNKKTMLLVNGAKIGEKTMVGGDFQSKFDRLLGNSDGYSGFSLISNLRVLVDAGNKYDHIITEERAYMLYTKEKPFLIED